jgi:aryl-alcohol dehydrogenase-like predicted oxidoreductase
MTAEPLPTRTLGRGDHALTVSAIGLGCMTMAGSYGARDDAEAVATLHRAIDLGVTLFDTADVYGDNENERFVGAVLRERRDEVVIATKFGLGKDEIGTPSINGSPDYVRRACDASLSRLGIDTIDLYYQHRVDTSVPIEETWGALSELVTAGKVRFLGISEPSVDSLRRAHATHPVTALQNEWSLWSRELEDEILPVCRELGIGVVPFSPLGRGFLTGDITSPDDFTPEDFRRGLPRFQGENFQRNLDLVAEITALADARGVTPAQLALAWLLAHGDDVVPIPGTKRTDRLAENVAAANIVLTDEERRRIDEIAPVGAAFGDRYRDMSWVNR